MGHRQLALIFGIGTALIALAIAAIRMMFDIYDGIGVIITAALFLISSILLLLVAKKKWELGYRNAFAMLFSASIICSLVYAFGYSYVQEMFQHSLGKASERPFGSMLLVNLAFRLPLDAVVAIFQKRR